MTKLNAIREFVIANNLFDLLTYRIEKLDDYDNYLFVIEPITFEDCNKWTKIFTITYTILTILTIIGLPSSSIPIFSANEEARSNKYIGSVKVYI